MNSSFPQVPIEFLIELNQGLEEESRIFNQLKSEARRIDEEVGSRYQNILDSVVKLGLISQTVKTRSPNQSSVRYD